jgi:hypothetical protein
MNKIFINHIKNKLFDDASGDIWQNVRLWVKMQVMEDIRDKVEQSQISISTSIYLTCLSKIRKNK